MKEKEKKEIFWYDNPNTITSIIIGLIAVIIILSIIILFICIGQVNATNEIF